MSTLFPTDRALLHPHFETYRLRSLDPESDVLAYVLPNNGATQSRVKGGRLLSFKEMQGRVHWDHLCAGSGGRLVYIDEAYKVIGVKVEDGLQPTFTELTSLPVPISSSPVRSEFPSALFLSDDTWAVSPGNGILYILSTTGSDDAAFTGRITAEYELGASESHDSTVGISSASGVTLSPFLLQASHCPGGQIHKLLLSRLSGDAERTKSADIKFELLEVEVDTSVEASDLPLRPQWALVGSDLPVWTAWHANGWVVASGSGFKQAGEEASGATESTVEQSEEDIVQQIAPYTWTQNSSSLSVQIPLPTGTRTSDILCQLTTSSLELALKNASEAEIGAVPSKFLDSLPKRWWDKIKMDDSTWTWHAEDGRLELELTKVHDGVRWPSVFDRTADDEDEEMSDSSSVRETFTEEQMDAIRANLSQFHTDASKVPESGLPGLLKEEMDDEDEEGGGVFGDRQESAVKVGREIMVGSIVNGVAKWSKQSAWLLSLPASSTPSSDKASRTLVIKAGVDAGLFAPSDSPSRSWTHLSTSPALAFVLSSKRSTRTVVHCTRPEARGPTVLAFEAGDSSSSANVFAFFPPSVANATDAQQGVVRVGGAERGSLLGVKEVEVNGRGVIVALCEKSLVLLPNL